MSIRLILRINFHEDLMERGINMEDKTSLLGMSESFEQMRERYRKEMLKYRKETRIYEKTAPVLAENEVDQTPKPRLEEVDDDRQPGLFVPEWEDGDELNSRAWVFDTGIAANLVGGN